MHIYVYMRERCEDCLKSFKPRPVKSIVEKFYDYTLSLLIELKKKFFSFSF